MNRSKSELGGGVTRRSFLGGAAAASLGVASVEFAQAQAKSSAVSALEILRSPDRVTAFAGLEERIPLAATSGAWGARQIVVRTVAADDSLAVHIASPQVALTHVHLRWKLAVAASLLVLGDAWERSYGELAWRRLVPERVLPWYFATHDGTVCNGYGVKTGARSLCFWQVDAEGVSLWLNVSNGGNGVHLGQRELLAAEVVTHRGAKDEQPMTAMQSLCKRMCSKPALSFSPVYGTNDWYYAYGQNTAEGTLRDADLAAALSTGNAVRPFSVIDEGWEKGPPTFPDMAKLAQEVRSRGVRPGIWVRPLKVLKSSGSAADLLLPSARFASAKDAQENPAFDPTIPEAQALIRARVKQLADWGYELVKHDFSTYDLLGQWGFQMMASPTIPGWNLQDKSKTNAEVILDLYALIREAAGKETGEKTVIIGCNTIGHLSQGIFEGQRTGDDTSGRLWERTRRMGVNTLAYRLPQHRTFFVQDADCVALTSSIPWELTRQWLELIAQTGTALFISPQQGSVGPEQRRAIQAAFARVASGRAVAAPLDWLDSTAPEEWLSEGPGRNEPVRYRWSGPEGADPFHV